MMSKGKRIIEVLTDENPDAILYDGMDEALIGIYRGDLARADDAYDSIAVYSYVKFIQIYIERDGMSEEEAIEHFEFNVMGAWVGDGTPAFMKVIVPDEMLTFGREMIETAGVKK